MRSLYIGLKVAVTLPGRSLKSILYYSPNSQSINQEPYMDSRLRIWALATGGACAFGVQAPRNTSILYETVLCVEPGRFIAVEIWKHSPNDPSNKL